MTLLLRLGVLLLLAYLAVCVLVWLTQSKLVWFPGPPPRTTPGDLGMAFRDVELVTEDGVRLHAWFLPPVRADARGAVLVSHGNAGSIEYRIDVARAFLDMGCAVLLFDYRGYGKSGGAPDEEGTYLDAVAAYEHLTGVEGYPGNEIVLYGESLGAAVAIELARRRPVRAVVAESAFTSVPDVGAEVYPFLPVRLLARIRYDNHAKLPELDVPVLLVHSPDDEIVPVEHARRLFEVAPEPRKLLLTAGGHNDGGFRLRAEWRTAVETFVRRALAPDGAEEEDHRGGAEEAEAEEGD